MATQEQIRQYIKYVAAPAYRADAGVLDYMAFAESGYTPGAVNDWDSNAAAGHRSEGLMQFIKATFLDYAAKARKANPAAWKGFKKLNWHDWRQQALAASWAITHNKGSAWATYDAAKQHATGVAVPGGRITQVLGPASASDHQDHVHVAGEDVTGPKDKRDPTRTWVIKRARSYGLSVTSNDRTPAHNAEVGGAANSDHLTTKRTTWAVDASGARTKMLAFEKEMQGYVGGAVPIGNAGAGGGGAGNINASLNPLDWAGDVKDFVGNKLVLLVILLVGLALAGGLIVIGGVKLTGAEQKVREAGLAVATKGAAK